MPAPDVQYFLDCSLECGHISGDTHHYFMEVAVDSNEVLDAYDAEGRTFHKHWSSLADTGLHMERNYLDWRGSNDVDKFKRQTTSFMGLWSIQPLLQQHIASAADVAVSAGYDRWTPQAHALLDREFEFTNTVRVIKRSINRAASDFDGWDLPALTDMRHAVERRRHEDEQRQIQAIQRIRGLVGTGVITAEAISQRLGPLTNEREVRKAKKMVADRVHRERGVIKRSARFLSKLLGAETTRLYIGGHAIRVEGRHAIYELKKRSSLMDAHGGFAALSVFDKDHPDLHLCDVCIFTSGVPLLDHIASLVMHIQTGHEEDLLSIGNPTNCSKAAYELEWLKPHLPKPVSEFGLPNMIGTLRPWEVASVKNRAEKIERIKRDLQRYIYDEVMEPHQKLLWNMREVVNERSSFYLENFAANPLVALPIKSEQVIQDGLDALDEVLAQLPQPTDMVHAQLIEQALDHLFEPDTDWVD